ncbi:Putative TonB-dependent receptor [Chromobacterium vaccinii]|nr:Putative TonB-dependent receptor [Chromobacterium vaccinii]QND87894.1 Putative TonB-dependent receptor [Chromobacterium vaccinii]
MRIVCIIISNMKSSAILQYSALGGVLAAHALALTLLNGMPASEQTVTPPQALRMEMISLAPADKPAAAPKSAPAPEPVKPQLKPQSKPTPSKPAIQPKPDLQPVKTQADAPAPAKAISVAPAAPAPAAEAPKNAGGGKTEGRDLPVTEPQSRGGYLNNPAPAYPTVSREEGEEGTVRLRVHVSAQGLPQDVSVQSSSGFPRLDRAALAAVKRWRFIPAKRGGEAIAYPFIVPIEFSLKSANT